MKRFTSKTQKIGETGENICATFLLNNGFIIKERNYTIPKGEIDIIAEKENILHFIEVKSLQVDNTENVSYETYNPAENMTKSKIQKCWTAINHYKAENFVSCETQLDLYMVYIDKNLIKHKISRIENIF